MVKLIALYRTPDDISEFDAHYFKVHLPLITKIPGLQKVEITKIQGAPLGETPYHAMAEMYFESMEAMNAGNASPEGKAAARDLMTFGAKYVTLFFGEVEQ